MKRIVLTAAVLCLVATAQPATTAMAQSATPKPRIGAGGPRSDLVSDDQIRKLYAEFVVAWNAHDPKKMASFWTIDGDTMEPDGVVAKQRHEVERHFAEEHSGPFKNTELKLTIDSIWFAGADVALVDGTYMVIGAVDPNGQPLPPRKGLLTSVLIKEDGNWQVAASRSMIPIPLPWRPQK